MAGYSAGQDSPVGRGTFDHPESIGTAIGTAGDPVDGPVDPGPSGGEIPGFQQGAGIRGDDRVGVVTGVRVDAHDKWMGMRDDRHGGHWVPFLFTDMVMAVAGRYQSG